MAAEPQSVFVLPDLGEGLQEAEIVAWHVAEGDHVVADQPLVSVETDKAVVEIPSPRSGRIAQTARRAADAPANRRAARRVRRRGRAGQRHVVVAGEPAPRCQPSPSAPPRLRRPACDTGGARAGSQSRRSIWRR